MSASTKLPAIVSGANLLHNRGITGKNITVAVMDSGLSPHPDISSDRILAFQDFIANKENPYDDYSHGTHVSGIIASSKIGVAPECQIVNLKVLDHKGNGSSDIFIEGIKWILENREYFHIQIVNISIGGTNAELKREKSAESMGRQIMGGRYYRLLFCRKQGACP